MIRNGRWRLLQRRQQPLKAWPNLVTFWPSYTCDLAFFPLTFLHKAADLCEAAEQNDSQD